MSRHEGPSAGDGLTSTEPSRQGARILFQLTGSIAAYKACAAISKLAQAGHDVQTVASAGALKFVGAATLEGLTGRPVLSDLWESGQAMRHIQAIRWADVAVLCPASANALNKLAAGIGDDLISTLFLAHDFKKPYLAAPAMNSAMYAHPATQASLARLRGWGVDVLEPDSGALACGETGPGRLLEPEKIVAAVERALRVRLDHETSASPTSARLRVLVTSGGTQEPIDSVRAISNFSTGRTGAAIAGWLAGRGHEVALLRARGSARPNAPTAATIAEFSTFQELESELRERMATGGFDAVVHAAAVGDYSVEKVEDASGAEVAPPRPVGKIDSSSGLVIRLKRNPKLLGRLREWARSDRLAVVAFKLTSGASTAERERAVAKLFAESRPDFVVQNDLSEIAGDGGAHESAVYANDGRVLRRCRSKDELAAEIERALLARLGKETT